MTVKELIVSLSKYDQDLQVRFEECQSGDYLDIDAITKTIDQFDHQACILLRCLSAWYQDNETNMCPLLP